MRIARRNLLVAQPHQALLLIIRLIRHVYLRFDQYSM
jgi:hypothetical protein